MADFRASETQERTNDVEGCLPAEPSSVCENLQQNFCATKDKPPEAVSGEHLTLSLGDDGCGCGTQQSAKETALSDTMSSERSLPKGHRGGDTGTLLSDPCTPVPAMCTSVQSSCSLVDGSVQAPLLVCKRSMQLPQCSLVTTVCRGPLCSDGTGPQLLQGPEMSIPEETLCDSSQCFASHFHPTSFEDTFAAYCHPQPIPAVPQISPPMPAAEGTVHLNLPHFMSSLSDNGMNAKHFSCCCQFGCSWTSAFSQPQMPCGLKTLTHDVGTITTVSQRDVAVQTEGRSSHVFPQVCLSEEVCRGSKTSQDAPRGGSKSPVKEVKWDAEGMTWEVYGASVDPEELGLAIQKHLELQIKETANRAAKLSRQNTNTSRNSVSCQRKKRMLSSLRPVCCVHTSAVVD